MVVESSTLQSAADAGIDLNRNAFLLIHGWTAGPLLIEFADKLIAAFEASPKTAARIAIEVAAKEGPLAILLRTCSVLGYLNFDAATGTYSLVEGEELDELRRCLGPHSTATQALRRIYAEACPPFRIPSSQLELCLEVLKEHRGLWKGSKSQALSILLDGIALSPILVSLTYFARWDEQGLDLGKDKNIDGLDFGKLDEAAQALLGDIFLELGVGTLNPNGSLSMTSKGSLAVQRVFSFYVPTSYSPLLSRFSQVLHEDAGWGFHGESIEDRDPDEGEIHVERH